MFKKAILLTAAILSLGAISFAQTDRTTTKTTTTKSATTTKTAPQTATTKPVTATTGTATADSAALTGDAKLVRAAFDRLVKGIEDSDVDAVMSVYQNSPNTLYFNNNGSVTRGYEQDRINRQSRYPKITNAKLVPAGVRIEMLAPGAALLTCQWTQTQDFDGKTETAAGRMTLVFKKIGKDYKIVHLHTSPDVVPTARPLLTSERDGQ